jgi:ParB-like chromosome segregation protein Spo0J
MKKIMEIKTIPISKINPVDYNPRKDLQPSDPEYKKLKKSLTEFDCIEPLVWNEKTGNLVGGHQRLKVLKEMGRAEVEVSIVRLDDAKEKALNLALNKISGEWDLPRLKDLLEEINTGAFDIEITGFDDKEIEELMTQFHVPGEGLTDDDAIPEQVEPTCKTGDLWQLGGYIICPKCGKQHNL